MQLAQAASRPDSWRPLALLAVAFLAVTVALAGWPAASRAAMAPPAAVLPSGTTDGPDGSDPACTGRPAFKVVVVVGPVGSSTSRFIGWANEIAAAARAAGMAVCTVYTPYADAATVKAAARGASVFVALMHGNGYPKPNRSLQDGSGVKGEGNDATAHGLGLNASRGSSALKYHGADWVRANLALAPDAIVILSHMCFTSGNSEDYDRIPSYDLAVRHVDNFAQGFLGSASEPPGGSPSVVMALQSQSFDRKDPAGDLFRTLMGSPGKTLDEAFMTTYTRNGGTWKDAYLPNFGAVGSSDFYVDRRPDGKRLRSPGRIHIDPDLAHVGRRAPAGWDPDAPDIAWLDWFAGKTKKIANPRGSGVVRFGYVRSITGRLELPVRDWQASAAVEASGGTSRQARRTIPDIRDMARRAARRTLKEAGFAVPTVTIDVPSTAVETGRAVDTKPSRLRPDGTKRKVAIGTSLTIRVSSGP